MKNGIVRWVGLGIFIIGLAIGYGKFQTIAEEAKEDVKELKKELKEDIEEVEEDVDENEKLDVEQSILLREISTTQMMMQQWIKKEMDK